MSAERKGRADGGGVNSAASVRECKSCHAQTHDPATVTMNGRAAAWKCLSCYSWNWLPASDAPRVPYPQEETLDRATVERWRSEAVTAPAQDRLWLQRCEALCYALVDARARPDDRPNAYVSVELQHRHRIMVHALRVILDDAERAGLAKTRSRLERLHDELTANRPMPEWSLRRIIEGDAKETRC